MEFKHILVPYDGSKASGKALDRAIWMAGLFPETKLTVAHVVYVPPLVVADLTFIPTEEYHKQIQKHTDILTEAVQEKLGDLQNANVTVLSGPPASTLLMYADTEKCDLIIMGCRGLGPIRELMLGSVSHNVVQNAKVPVLIIK